jgi:flagellar biosynthesis regulator FlbT
MLNQLLIDVAKKSDIDVFRASKDYHLFNVDLDAIIAKAKDPETLKELKAIKEEWHKGIYSNYCSPAATPVLNLMERLEKLEDVVASKVLKQDLQDLVRNVMDDKYHEDED